MYLSFHMMHRQSHVAKTSIRDTKNRIQGSPANKTREAVQLTGVGAGVGGGGFSPTAYAEKEVTVIGTTSGQFEQSTSLYSSHVGLSVVSLRYTANLSPHVREETSPVMGKSICTSLLNVVP